MIAVCSPNSPDFAVIYYAALSVGAVVTTINPMATPDDVAVLPYSSGTTGLPKGVVLTHRGLVANLCGTRPAHPVGADDVIVAVLPLFHIYGMQVTMNLGLAAGATVVTMPSFDLESFLRLVQDRRITRAELVPPIVLAKDPRVERYDLSSLRVVTSAAAPLGEELARLCAERLGCRVKQAYRMTELGGGTHFAPDDGQDRPESIGRPLPGVERRAEGRREGVSVFSFHPGIQAIGLTEAALAADAPPDSPEGRVAGWLCQELVEGRGAEPDRAAQLVVQLAAGYGDSLSGRHISVHDDLDLLLERLDEIRRIDLYTLRLRDLRPIGHQDTPRA